MNLYYICFFILFFGGLFEVSKSKLGGNSKNLFLFLIGAFFSVVVYLTRDAVDHETYERIYARFINSPNNWAIDMFPEFGFQWFNHFFNYYLGFDFHSFRAIFALITLLITFTLSKYMTNKTLLFTLLYYPKYFLGGVISHIRSSFIYPFIFLVIHFTEKKKFFYIGIVSLLLSQIHMSALLLNVVPLAAYFKGRASYALLVIPFSILFYFALSQHLVSFFSSFGFRQANYFVSESDSVRAFFGIEMLKRFCVCLLIYYLYRCGKINTFKEDMTCKLLILSVAIYYCFFDARFISDRVPAIFSFLEPLVFIYLYQSSEKKINQVVSLFILFIYATLDFFLRMNFSSMIPDHIDIF